jgi:hypothetical protein
MLLLSVFSLIEVAASGCGAADDGAIEAQTGAVTAVPGLPEGLSCGVSYTNSFNVALEWETCLGVPTLGGGSAPNYNNRSIGDRGRPAGRGFFDQAYRGGSWVLNDSNSDRLALVPGTVCGFKETCNNAGELCMGHDPRFNCPPGWTRHMSGDELAPSGCGFAWCSYNDPHEICCSGGACNPDCVNNMPQGTACGMGDTRFDDGFCENWEVLGPGCPPGFHKTSDSYDYGRPAHSGLYWCTKN